jgi:hypothetical protein
VGGVSIQFISCCIASYYCYMLCSVILLSFVYLNYIVSNGGMIFLIIILIF